jgi:hypothetical protein
MDVVMTQAPPTEDTTAASTSAEAPAPEAAEAPTTDMPVDNTPAPSPTLYIKNLNEKIKLDGNNDSQTKEFPLPPGIS